MPKLSSFLHPSLSQHNAPGHGAAQAEAPKASSSQPSSSNSPATGTVPTTAAPLSGRATESNRKFTSRLKKISTAMAIRPFTIGQKLMGIGYTKGTELGKTNGLPPAAAQKKDTVEGLLGQANALTRRLNRIIDSSLERLPDINKRPQRSLAMKVVVAAIPCFKPAHLGDLIADDPAYAGAGANGGRRGPAASPADTRAQRRTSLSDISNLVQVTKTAEAALLAAQAGWGNEIESEEELNKAGNDYQVAIEELRAALVNGSMVGANDNALATEVLSHRMDYLRGQIEHVTERLDQSGLDIKARKVLLEQRRDGMQERVELARLKLHTAGLSLNDLCSELNDSPSQSESQTVPVDAEALAEHRDRASQKLAEIKQQVSLCEESLMQETAALEEFLPGFTREMDLLAGQNADIEAARAELHAAGQPLAHKAESWQARATETRELESAHHEQLVLALVTAPPGFSAEQLATPGGLALKACLRELANDLPANDPQAERELPRVATVEIVCRAFAGVTNGNAQDAADLLRAVMSHPTEHWLPMPDTGTLPDARPSDTTHAPPSPAMRNLFHRMADVPRGLEVLNQLSLRDGRAPMGRQQSEALQAYWLADKAQAQESSPEVAAWLASAKFVAQHEVRNRKKEPPVFDTTSLPLDKLIAFRAVSKGIISNAPDSEFGNINRKLLKLNGQWVDAAKDKRHKLLQGLPRKTDPSKGKTPFHPHAVRMAVNSMEAQGMSTLRSKASDSVAAIAEELLARVAGGCMTKREHHKDDLQSRAFDETVSVLCEYVRDQGRRGQLQESWKTDVKSTRFHETKRLYKANLEARDFEHILREASKRLDLPTGAGKFPDPFFRDLFREKKQLPALEALQRVAEYIDLTLAPWDQEKLGLTQIRQQVKLDTIDAKIEQAEREQFSSREDVVKFFEPMLGDLKLRQQVTITAGGEKGLGIPLIPWTPVKPWIASLNMNIYSKKDEATFQVKSPTFGVEFMIGETTTHAHDIKGTAGLGFKKAKLNLSVPAVSAKVERTAAEADLLVIRILRTKDDNGVREEQKARDDSLSLLDTMLRWDAEGKHPVAGEKFNSPIEAVLALHPDVLLGRAEKTSGSTGLTVDISLAARIELDRKNKYTLGGAINTNIKAEKATEVMNERSGFAHQVVHDRSDQRKQRWGAGAGVSGIATLYKKLVMDDGNAQAGHAKDKAGTWRLPASANILDITRELASNLEKNGATRFAMGDRTGGSVDRSYGTAKDLLAEIEANREDFFIRFLETIPLAPDAERDTPEHRELALSSLNQFISDLKVADKNPSLQFNIKYEMQPRMSGWVDALNAMETIALQNGDEQGALDARKAKGDLMSYRSTWAFKNCAVRNKGKETNGTGLDFIARWQSKQTVETSSAFTAYPA